MHVIYLKIVAFKTRHAKDIRPDTITRPPVLSER